MINRFYFDVESKFFSFRDEYYINKYEKKLNKHQALSDRHLDQAVNARGLGQHLAKPYHYWRAKVNARKADNHQFRLNMERSYLNKLRPQSNESQDVNKL